MRHEAILQARDLIDIGVYESAGLRQNPLPGSDIESGLNRWTRYSDYQVGGVMMMITGSPICHFLSREGGKGQPIRGGRLTHRPFETAAIVPAALSSGFNVHPRLRKDAGTLLSTD